MAVIRLLAPLMDSPSMDLAAAAACALATLCWAPRNTPSEVGTLQLDPDERTALAVQLPHVANAFLREVRVKDRRITR